MRPGGIAFVSLVLLFGCDKKPSSSGERDAAATSTSAAPTTSASSPAGPASSDAPNEQSAGSAQKACDAGVLAILGDLNEPMTVTAYMTRGQPKLDAFVDSLGALLERYEKASNGKLKVEIINPQTDAQKAAATNAGLQEQMFGEATSGDAVSLQQGFLGLVFEYGNEREVIPFLSPDSDIGLEFWVALKVRQLQSVAENRSLPVGVIDKEGIRMSDTDLVPPQGAPGPSVKGILEQALPYYRLQEIDLEEGAVEIDPDLHGVIVMQPNDDFSTAELARIDQFLMLGDKSLLIVAGAVQMQAADASMTATLSTHGLEPLLDGYGIEMKNEAVFDANAHMKFPAIGPGGSPTEVVAPGVLTLLADETDREEQSLDGRFAGFFRLQELAFPYPSELVLHPAKQPGAKLSIIAQTTASGTSVAAKRIDMKITPDWKPSGSERQRAVAVVAEGELTSAMAGNAPAEIKIATKTPSPSRIAVIASGQFLSNPFARAGNPPPMPPQMQSLGQVGGDPELQALATAYAQQYLTGTILAIKNLLDWMTTDEALIACAALSLPSAKPNSDDGTEKKCSKEQMIKLMDSGLSLDDALEVCGKR